MTLFRIVSITLMCGLLTACFAPSARNDPTLITGQLSELGYGPISINQTLPVDVPLSGWSEAEDSYEAAHCRYVGVDTEHGVLAIMVVKGVVARIDPGDEGVRLENGIGLGSRRTDIIAAYGDEAVSRRNFYVGSSGYIDYMVLLSADTGVYFEMQGNAKVRAFRVGRLPELEAVEGCQ